MLEIKRFINNPVPSNTYLVSIKNSSSCIVIDPGSKDEAELIEFINGKRLSVDYILLTHEHFDHCWGVNELIEKTGAKVVCTQKCKDRILSPSNYFNKFYFDSEEEYNVNKVNIVVDEIGYNLKWDSVHIHFIETMGHSPGSVCISVENILFTGDTIMLNTKPVLMKRLGSSKVDYKESVMRIFSSFPDDTMVYPGHGEPFELLAAKEYYESYFSRF